MACHLAPLLAAALSAAAPSPPPASQPAAPPAAPAQAPARATPAEPAASPRLTVEQVLAGAPPGLRTLTLEQARRLPGFVRDDVRPAPSDWAYGEGAEAHAVVLPGLVLEFVTGRGARSVLTRATYDGPAWVLPGGLRVGMPAEAAEKLLGPEGGTGAVRSYTSSGPVGAESLELLVKDGAVARITLTPYSG